MTVREIAGRVALPPGLPGAATPPLAPHGPAFADLLRQVAGAEPPRLVLSAHATQRAEQRGIDVSEPAQRRIAEALDTLDAKGARDALLLGPDAAFVVHVPSRTVVTALDPSEARDRVFTQIDSAALL